MRPGESPPGPNRRITEADVRNVLFHKPPFGKRGYDESEVDNFLDALADKLAGRPGSRLTADSVHGVAFRKPPFGKRGYDEEEVDSFLDLIEAELRLREAGGRPALPAGRSSASARSVDSGPPPRPVDPGLLDPAPPPRPMDPGLLDPGLAPPRDAGLGPSADSGAVVRAIWERTEDRDWHGVAELIDPGFICEWPESRERFRGRDAWITMNVNYPSNWHITIDDIVAQGERVASRVRVSDENGTFHATSFWSVLDGRAVRLTEYYLREGSAVPPEWRAQWAERY